jgi:Protein of unknown function (DUF2950)
VRLVRSLTHVALVAAACAVLTAAGACNRGAPKTFATPEDAVRALIDAAKTKSVDPVVAIFGRDGQALIDSAEPATARRNREVFSAAVAEKWHLDDQPDGTKLLVIGNEDWPFPVPLIKAASGWRFDTAAGTEEVIARRIGRNELATIRICSTYVAAQRLYAEVGHDGQPAGRYAKTIDSEPGRQNGLYWPAAPGQKRSPLGDLVAHAAAEGRRLGKDGGQPSPFHGYHFKILTAQGAAARGGAKDYVVDGHLSGGFALVAWPAQYDATGIMTFVVNHEGVVHEKDLGVETAATASAMTRYDPDSSWKAVNH